MSFTWRPPPNSCFVNNYFSDGLKSWQTNMDIQPVFNEYKAVTYMPSYFSKPENQCSAAMTQAAKRALDNELDNFHAMENILQAYTSRQECSVQEAAHHVLQELLLPFTLFCKDKFTRTALKNCFELRKN